MIENMTDDEFHRRVAGAHDGLQAVPGGAPTPGDAWTVAGEHRHEFEDAAIDLMAVRMFHAENGRIARNRLN